MVLIRVTCALALLVPALLLVKLAYWACPEIAKLESPNGAMEAELQHWVNVPRDWDEKVQ